jgi:CRISPR-associated protein Cas2
MIIINVSNCPPKLKGDLTKWLIEINTGIYVGKVNAKVREKLWERVCENISLGNATMVFSTNTEQGFAFKVHNSSWIPTDYEGITLMKIPIGNKKTGEENSKYGFSKVSKYDRIRRVHKSKPFVNYVILDLETTGLDAFKDSIIEIGALKVKNGIIVDEFHRLVKYSKKLEQSIVDLTGITDEMLTIEGVSLDNAIRQLFDFIKDDVVVGYNIKFDIDFLLSASNQLKIECNIRKTKDILKIARRKIENIKDYKLLNVAEYFSIDTSGMHRAVRDCYIAYDILNKLNEN